MRDIPPQLRRAQARLKIGGYSEPQRLVFAVAGHIIHKADRQHPADALLRHELTAQRRFAPDFKAQVSLAVFAYYRWRGWLDLNDPMLNQIKRALDLAEEFADRPASFSDNELVTHAVPPWVRDQIEVVPAWVRTIQGEPKLWLRARPGQRSALAESLGIAQAARAGCGQDTLPDTMLYEGNEDLFRRPEFHAGEFEIQDISSQVVGLLCDPQPGEVWWDACAGEGGKTLHLAALMRNKGLVWASDRAAWRLQRLRRRAARARVFNYRAALWDGDERPPTRTKFDGVLVDAPCSGLGTWQRNPHARWTTTLEDVHELSEVQLRLLTNVAKSLKPWGKLIYVACTLTRAETVDVAARVEKQFPELSRLSLRNPLKPSEPPQNQLWLWPQDGGGNGMFVAAWQRRSDS
ncbi:MAG: RsmB/NOP family class I SAM-dependent RNA methyltransferase [Verrucomicrobiota bacterium]